MGASAPKALPPYDNNFKLIIHYPPSEAFGRWARTQ